MADKSKRGSKPKDSKKEIVEEVTDGSKPEQQKKQRGFFASKAHFVDKRLHGIPKSSNKSSTNINENEEGDKEGSDKSSPETTPNKPGATPPEERQLSPDSQWAQWQPKPPQPMKASHDQFVTVDVPPLQDQPTVIVQRARTGNESLPVNMRVTHSSAALEPPKEEKIRAQTEVIHVHPHTPQETTNIHELLTKTELERNRLKRDLEYKDKVIQDYELEILQYKSQARSPLITHQQQPNNNNNNNDQLQLTLQEKEKDINELNRLLAECDASIVQLKEEKAGELKKISEEKESLRIRVVELEKEIEAKEMNNNVIVEEVRKEMQKEIDELKQSLNETGEELTSAKKEIDELKLSLNETGKELTSAKKKIDELKQSLNETGEELTSAKKEIDELKQSQITAEAKSKQSIALLQKRLKEKEEEKEAETNNEKLERELSEAKKELELAVQNIEKEKTIKQELKTQLYELEKKGNENVEAIQQQQAVITHLKDKLHEEQTENADAKNQIDTERKKKGELQKRIDVLEKENTIITEQSTKRVGELEEQLKKTQDETKQQINELSAQLKQQNKTLTAQLQQKEEERNIMETYAEHENLEAQLKNVPEKDQKRIDEHNCQFVHQGAFTASHIQIKEEHRFNIADNAAGLFRVGQLEEQKEQLKVLELQQQITNLNVQLEHERESSSAQLQQKEKEYRQNIAHKKAKYKGILEGKTTQLEEQYRQQLHEETTQLQDELRRERETTEHLREEMKLLQEKVPVTVVDEGASATGSLSEEDKAKKELELQIEDLNDQLAKVENDARDKQNKMKQEMKEQIDELNKQIEDLKEHHEIVSGEKEGTLITKHRDEMAVLQRKHDRKEKLIKDLNEQLKELNALKEVNEKLTQGLNHKCLEFDGLLALLEEKETELAKSKKDKETELERAREERKQTVEHVKKQLEAQKVVAKEAEKKAKDIEEDKLKAVTALVEKLQVKEAENAIYKADFEGERNDRQRIHHELTELKAKMDTKIKEIKDKYQKECHDLKQSLTDNEYSIEQLIERNKTLEVDIDGKADEIEILTAQVNAYSDRCDEIKRALTNSEDKRGELEGKISELKKKIDPMTEQVERAKAQEEELISLRDRVNRLENQLKQNKDRKYPTEIAELNQELTVIREQLDEALQSKKQLSDELASIRQQLNDVTKSRESLLTSYEQERTMNDNMKRELNELHTMNTRLKDANKVLAGKVTYLQSTGKTPPTGPIPSHQQIKHVKDHTQQRLSDPNLSVSASGQAPPPTNAYHVPGHQEKGGQQPYHPRGDQRNLSPTNARRTQPPYPQYDNNSANIKARSNVQTPYMQPPVQSTGDGSANEAMVPNTSQGQNNYVREYSDTANEDNPPAMTQEEMTRLFGGQTHLQQQQQPQYNDEQQWRRQQNTQEREEEKERKRIQDEADRALREVEEMRQQGSPNSQRKGKPQAKPRTKILDNNLDDSKKAVKKKGSREELDDTPIPENVLIDGIDREIQEAAQWVRDQSKRPTTAEVEADEFSSLPYDPNLVCPKCGKRFHIGGIQMFKRHVKKLCPLLEQ